MNLLIMGNHFTWFKIGRCLSQKEKGVIYVLKHNYLLSGKQDRIMDFKPNAKEIQ